MADINIRLYAADVRCLADSRLYVKALGSLGSVRRAKAERIKHESAKRLSAGAGVLLNYAARELYKDTGINILEEDGNIPVEYRENGKPYIAGRGDIFFNLSHSGDMVICAIAPCEVGCDIEAVLGDRSRIAGRYFTEEEQRFAALGEENFFRMWTLKESFLKVTGRGLALPLDSFSIRVLDDGITVDQSVDSRSYIFKEYTVFEGYCCSLCAADAGGAVFEDTVRNCDIEQIIM